MEVVATNLLGNPAVAGIVVNARDVTERVEVAAQLEDRADVAYARYLSWRGLLEVQPPNRPEPNRPSSSAVAARGVAAPSATARRRPAPAAATRPPPPHPPAPGRTGHAGGG